MTPFVLESENPSAADQDVPWWWKESRRDLREREEKILEQREVYKLQTVDHGQVVKYEGDRPVETAKSGILRVGSHSKYGFGELRVTPVEPRSEKYQNSEENEGHRVRYLRCDGRIGTKKSRRRLNKEIVFSITSIGQATRHRRLSVDPLHTKRPPNRAKQQCWLSLGDRRDVLQEYLQ